MTELTILGRRRPLRFTINALCALEEKTGGSLEGMLRGGLSSVRGLLWCGLLGDEPSLTLEGAGQLLEAHLQAGGSLHEIAKALARGLEEAGFFQPGEEGQRPALP